MYYLQTQIKVNIDGEDDIALSDHDVSPYDDRPSEGLRLPPDDLANNDNFDAEIENANSLSQLFDKENSRNSKIVKNNSIRSLSDFKNDSLPEFTPINNMGMTKTIETPQQPTSHAFMKSSLVDNAMRSRKNKTKIIIGDKRKINNDDSLPDFDYKPKIENVSY